VYSAYVVAKGRTVKWHVFSLPGRERKDCTIDVLIDFDFQRWLVGRPKGRPPPPTPPLVRFGGVWWWAKTCVFPMIQRDLDFFILNFWSILGCSYSIFGPFWGAHTQFLVHKLPAILLL
jgi:hypothetical protein